MNLQKYFKYLPYLIIISSFGIYLGLGVRVEHLVIYPSVLIFLMFSIISKRLLIKNQLTIFIMWGILVLIASIVTINNGGQVNKIFADIESFIQPIFLMVLFMFVSLKYNTSDTERTIVKSSQVLIFMLSLNTIFIFSSLFIEPGNLSRIGQLFWGGSESVAYNAMTNGRFSGVFNQPMEAGAAYSLGLLVWLYLSDKLDALKLKYVITLFLMVGGGLITVSKVFLFGGLPLFFIGVLFNKKIMKRILTLFWWSGLIGYALYYFFFKTWSGLNYLLRFFDSDKGLISLVTGGRYGGQTSAQMNFFVDVWEESPVYGRGFGVTTVYDSALFQFFAVGGALGLTIYLFILCTLFFVGVRFIKINKMNSESKLYMFITLLIIGCSIGAPILTLNRVSTLIWVFIGLLLQYVYFERSYIAENRSMKQNTTIAS